MFSKPRDDNAVHHEESTELVSGKIAGLGFFIWSSD